MGEPILCDFLNELVLNCKARIQTASQRIEQVVKDIRKKCPATSGINNANPTAHKELPLPASCSSRNTTILELREFQQLVEDPRAEIPRRFSDIQVNFNRQQKLRIYEHVVERTGHCTEPERVIPPLEGGSISFAQIVAEKKREKIKKRRYRISKPTRTEEVRAMVDLQMQALQQYLEMKTRSEGRQRNAEKPVKSRKSPSPRRHRVERPRSRERTRHQPREGSHKDHEVKRKSPGPHTHKKVEHKRSSDSRPKSPHKNSSDKKSKKKSKKRSRSRSRERRDHKYHKTTKLKKSHKAKA